MHYSVYGFAIHSEFELPELNPISITEAENYPNPIVQIVSARLPEALPDETRLATWMSHSGRRCLYSIDGVVRLCITAGQKIEVDIRKGVAESDMRTFLLGSGLGAIAHQRGILPLHVSSVAGPEGAIAFTGPSGAGKSTTAATINARLGWPLISDDVAALHVSDGNARLEAGVYRCRLWRDALENLHYQTDGLVRDLQRIDKFQLNRDDLFLKRPQQLKTLIVLKRSVEEAATKVRVTSLKSSEKFLSFMNAIYRPELAALYQDRQHMHSTILAACANVDVLRVESTNDISETVNEVILAANLF